MREELVFLNSIFSARDLVFCRMEAQNPNEIFDVVDACDRVIGQATRAEVHAGKLLHRAVHILIFTPGGDLVLQRRSLAKDSCPGLLSSSCAGHVDSGESYDFAAVRELAEELGIDVCSGKHLSFVGTQSPSPENGFEFVRIYALRHFTGTLSPNESEIDALELFSPERLNAAIQKNPERFAPSFISVWHDFFPHESGRNI